jgi:hypothetical protein
VSADEYMSSAWGAIRYFGHPVYVMNDGDLEWDHEKIQRHNLLMKKLFPDLLSWVKDFFSSKLGVPVLFDDLIPYPGFHNFECKPGLYNAKNFHFDDYLTSLTDNVKHFKLPDNFSLYSFTVLLSDPKQLKSGVEWITTTKTLTREKLFSLPYLKVRLISQKHFYKQGELNLIGQDVFHNLFSHNTSDSSKDRITFQGHLIETTNGYIFFW